MSLIEYTGGNTYCCTDYRQDGPYSVFISALSWESAAAQADERGLQLDGEWYCTLSGASDEEANEVQAALEAGRGCERIS